VRTGIITFIAVAVPVAAASLVLGACGGSATSTALVPGSTQAGGPRPSVAPGDLGSVVSDALGALVDDGTITGAQKTAVVEAFGKGPQGGPPQASPPAPGQEPATKGQAPSAHDMLANVLDPLVDDGTLTGAQADAISQALADAMPGQPGARAPPSPAAEI
jgi:hypothetical protein